MIYFSLLIVQITFFSQLESRKENKMWLVRYLEVMRLLMLEDLSVVKSLCVPCFPPSYRILERYVNMYHGCLAKLVTIPKSIPSLLF